MGPSPIYNSFHHFIKKHRLFQKKDKILLAVSGGADSMILCDLFVRSGFEFGIAHCNFQLREEDADRDEAFVKKYAEKKQIPFHLKRFDTLKYAANNRLSIEEAARILRYQWFEEIRQTQRYQYIATAHHANDNAETLLFNLFRGTGIHGLHGILPKRDRIIRPLLLLSKAEILMYVEGKQIAYVTDSTNASTEYTRNYIRNTIIPTIEGKFPDVVGQLNKNINRFREAEQLYQSAVQRELERLVEKKGEEAFIPVLKLLKSTPLRTIVYEIFKDYGFNDRQVDGIINLAEKASGKVMRSSTHQLLKDRKWFIISPLQATDKTHFLIEEDTNKIMVDNIQLNLSSKSRKEYFLPSEKNIAALDRDKIYFPLVVRKWKQGDYFYPLGMRKKKKLSRFFIDQKLSLNQKEKVWVVSSGEHIVWVMGMRIDDRFKVTEKTQEVLQITMRVTD